ncbi:MAG TPA: hypothetical protein VKD21_07455 [Acidimicrobiales bacterium]|nr:hypothetical protein [Acidimicrobiales bacterium]
MPNHIRIIVAVALTAIVVLSLGAVGGGTLRPASAAPAAAPGIARYFGRGAFDGIRKAVAATRRTCALSDNDLTALVMAPIFKEVSMADTPDAVPSPMTLSRWDEWTGIRSGSSNLDANYGLYAFRDPGTRYARAYWNPGVGIFQYDPAGVGAPFTAAEMISVEIVTRDVAAGMAGRYCAAGGDAGRRRAAAWQPWGALGGIGKSEALFQEMLGGGAAPFSRIGLVDGVDNVGGMVKRQCLSGGRRVTCWYVDPRLAQGAHWWATSDPGGGAVASGMAPLSAPFYVVKRKGYEERHWLAEDTGYRVDISARRRLGFNARPMDGQRWSGLEWFSGSNLCDPARRGMGCAPPPPEPPANQAPKPPAPEPATAGPFGGIPVLDRVKPAARGR